MDDLERVMEKRRQSDADVIYTVTEGRRNPYFNQVMKQPNGFYFPVSGTQAVARQETPKVYDMNGSIYAYHPDYIASEEPLFKRADIVEMRDVGILDIDGPEDYELMQVIAAYLYENYDNYAAVKNYAETMRNN